MGKYYLTQHSGVGKGNARHNDRTAIKEAQEKGIEIADEHIDLSKENVYFELSEDEEHINLTKNPNFELREAQFYQKHYGKALELTNQSYIKNRHAERCKSITDLIKTGQRTAPEELIFQIGNKDNQPDIKEFAQVFKDYVRELKKLCEERGHIHILDISVHFDEQTPHAHIRRVIDYTDEKGVTHIGQAKGLEQAGFELPDPSKPRSRYNNRKMTLDSLMRDKFKEICKAHGLDIAEDVKEPGRKHINDKDKYIAYAQAQQIEKMAQVDAKLDKAINHVVEDYNANLDVYEGIERGFGIPEGSIADVVQKSVEETRSLCKSYQKLGIYDTDFNSELTDSIARNMAKLKEKQQQQQLMQDYDYELDNRNIDDDLEL